MADIFLIFEVSPENNVIFQLKNRSGYHQGNINAKGWSSRMAQPRVKLGVLKWSLLWAGVCTITGIFSSPFAVVLG